MGVLDGTKANSAPNLVGVGAGAELGKIIKMNFAVKDPRKILEEKYKHLDMSDIKYFGVRTSRTYNKRWYEGKIL